MEFVLKFQMSESGNSQCTRACSDGQPAFPPDEAAVFLAERFSGLLAQRSQHRCARCARADVPEGSLGLTTLARDGELVVICRTCFLSAEVHELATGGGVSAELSQHVEEQLFTLYSLLRAEIESRYGCS